MTRASDTAKLLGAGATILDGTTISTADNTTQLTLTSTDADALVGPSLDLYRNSASPADNDFCGQISFQAENDAGEKTTFGVIKTRIVDASNGTEDFRFSLEGMVAGSSSQLLKMDNTNTVFNEDSADIDFRVESDGNTHALHVDASSNRIGINSGATDLSAGNYATLNINGVQTNSGNQTIFADGSKGSFADASYKLMSGQVAIGDNTTQASGTGGGLCFTGRLADGDTTQVHGATIEAAKTNSTSNNYGFFMIGRTRENGNATMQTAYQYAYDRVQFFTNNTHRFNIDASGNLTATDTSIGSLSDERLKTNIAEHTYSLDTFKKYNVKTFDWKHPEEHGDRSKQKGLIAQEVEKVDSSFVYEYEVSENSKDKQYLTTTQITKEIVDDFTKEESTEIRDVTLAKASKLNQKDAMYISVIQQLLTKIETLEAKVTALESA